MHVFSSFARAASATRLKRSSRSFGCRCHLYTRYCKSHSKLQTNPNISKSSNPSFSSFCTTLFSFWIAYQSLVSLRCSNRFASSFDNLICLQLSVFFPAIPLLLWWRGWCWRLRPPQWFGRLTLNARSTRSDTPGNGSSPRQSNHWMGTGVI